MGTHPSFHSLGQGDAANGIATLCLAASWGGGGDFENRHRILSNTKFLPCLLGIVHLVGAGRPEGGDGEEWGTSSVPGPAAEKTASLEEPWASTG